MAKHKFGCMPRAAGLVRAVQPRGGLLSTPGAARLELYAKPRARNCTHSWAAARMLMCLTPHPLAAGDGAMHPSPKLPPFAF